MKVEERLPSTNGPRILELAGHHSFIRSEFVDGVPHWNAFSLGGVLQWTRIMGFMQCDSHFGSDCHIAHPPQMSQLLRKAPCDLNPFFTC